MCAAARPVVDGLARKYAADMNFYDLNATTSEGRAKMREFGMLFHGYAVVDRWGRLSWTSAGHSFTPAELEAKIEESLAAPPP